MRFIVFVVIIGLLISLITHNPLNASQWPWVTEEEPFPWLDYLANLTTLRNVRLIILTRHEVSIQSLTKKVFLESPIAKALGITEIQFLYVSAELWPDYIEQAKKLNLSIDVAWGGGPTLFNILDDMGYLMPINPEERPEHYAILYELSKIPEVMAGSETYKKDPDGKIRWIGASISSFGFTINKNILNRYGVPTARTWSDLTKWDYAKYLPSIPLIGIADPTKSTSNLRIFEIILQAKGWQEGWKTLTLLAANSEIYPGSGDARDAVIRGDVAIATTIDFYGYMAMNVNPDCEYIAPEGETIVNADPVAILKDTRYPVHAAAFVAWVLSEYGGQVVWLDKEINRIPINPYTFDTPQGLNRGDLKLAFENLQVLRGIVFNETLSANWINSVMYYFKATLVNAHSDLRSVWARIAKAYSEGRISSDWFEYLVSELSKPLKFKDPLTNQEVEFTLEYATKINRKLTEASVYQALMTLWEEGARARYQHVSDLLEKALRGEPIPTTTLTPTETPSTETPTTQPSTEQQVGISPLLIGLIIALILVVSGLLLLRRR